jgi:hypothetical protein
MKDESFVANIRRHFVSLTGVYVALNQGVPTGAEIHFCHSGFIIEIRGRLCFVTAGHVFQRLDDAIGQGRIRLLKCGLADYFSQEAIHKEPIPFPYDAEHRITIDNDEIMDIGLIPMRDLFCMNLRANGVVPLPVAPWEGRTPPRFDSYALLGLPEEEMVMLERTGERGPQIGHEVTLMLADVEALASPPADRIQSPIPRFAGILRDGGYLDRVSGMSGGPILGISEVEGGSWSYSCVAVQGSWARNERLLLGTPMSIVVDAIVRLLPQ